jgi:hypothetical protein
MQYRRDAFELANRRTISQRLRPADLEHSHSTDCIELIRSVQLAGMARINAGLAAFNFRTFERSLTFAKKCDRISDLSSPASAGLTFLVFERRPDIPLGFLVGSSVSRKLNGYLGRNSLHLVLSFAIFHLL